MTAQQIASFVDIAIPTAIGLCIVFGRRRIVSKVANPQRRVRTDKLLGIAGPLLLISAVLIGITSFPRGKREDVLTDTVAIINSKAPRMLDEVTRLDGAMIDADRRLVCRVTFTTYTSKMVDSKTWEEQVAPKIRAQIIRSPAIDVARKAGITIVYRFSGSDRFVIGEIIITPDDK